MEYITLYRKYRPQSFDDVIGQEHIVRIISNSIELNRLSHAYIFSGPRGTGKTSIARIFAKALNCRQGKSLKPCLKCDLCEAIAQGNAVDTIEIDAASNRGIDEIRQIKERIYFSPIEGQYKIYIIDEAHMLTDPAFNALLKTLEEPPSKTIFILATTEVNKIPLTILSRCQRLDFKLIRQKEIEDKIKEILKKEKVECEEKVIKIVGREAKGSLRDAISLTDQLISFRDEKIKLKDAFFLLGTSEEGHVVELLNYLVNENIKSMIKLIGDLTEDGKNLIQLTHSLVNYFRYLLMLKLNFNDLIDVDKETLKKLNNISNKLSIESIKNAISFLGKMETEIKWQSEIKVFLEINLLELMMIISKKKELIKEDIIDNKSEEIILEKEEKIPEKSSQSELDLISIKHGWNEVLTKIKEKKISVYTLVCEGDLFKFENSILTILFKKGYSFHKEKLEEENNRRILEEVLLKIFKNKIKTEYIVEGDKIQNRQSVYKGKEEDNLSEKNKDVETEKLVELFEGKVIEL